MIINPGNVIPINKPEGSPLDLIVFPVYQTREDYAQAHNGQQPPEPDPSLRGKYWYDPRFAGMQEDDGEVAVYKVIRYNPQTGQAMLDGLGRVQISQLVLPTLIAGRVNIPYGIANEFLPTETISRLKPYPFPIRDLHADEELAPPLTPFGDVRIINRRLKSQEEESLPGFTVRDRQMLRRVLELLEQRG